MDKEAKPGIEGDPGEDEVEGILDGCEEGKREEVDEPRSEQGGVGSVESFVGCEDGEKDSCCDANSMLDR